MPRLRHVVVRGRAIIISSAKILSDLSPLPRHGHGSRLQGAWPIHRRKGTPLRLHARSVAILAALAGRVLLRIEHGAEVLEVKGLRLSISHSRALSMDDLENNAFP